MKVYKLNAMVCEFISEIREYCAEAMNQLVWIQKMWALRKPIPDTHILSLQDEIQQQETDEIVMVKPINA